MVSHAPEKRPAHDLEQIAVEGRHETVGRRARGGRRASATWMYVIEVGALPHDLDELRVAVSTCRQPRFVWCQIAGVKVRNLVLGRKRPEWAKIPASAQIVVRIYLCCSAKRRGKQIGIAVRDDKFCSWACRVTAVAVAHSVDNIATQTHQRPVFSLQVQGNRSDFKPSLNSTLISLVIVVKLLQRFDYLPDAVARMVKRSGISPRQAYRYLQRAQLLAKPVPVGDLKVAFTVKLSRELVQRLRAFANRTDLSLSEIVSRALHAALPQRRRRG